MRKERVISQKKAGVLLSEDEGVATVLPKMNAFSTCLSQVEKVLSKIKIQLRS